MSSLWTVLSRPIGAWAEESQRGARRNAMVASTALASSRRQREDVDAYLDRALRRVPEQARPDDAAPVSASRLG